MTGQLVITLFKFPEGNHLEVAFVNIQIPSGKHTKKLWKITMLLMCKSTINGHVQWVNPRTKSTITMFYVANCESLPGRVNLHFPVVFLWFSYGFPMVYQAGCPQNIRLGPRGHPLPAARQRALGDHPPSGAPRTWDEIHPSIIYIWYDMYWYLWYIYIYI